MCASGIYHKDDGNSVRSHMGWSEFRKAKIYESGCLYIGNYHFVAATSTAKLLANFLLDMQRRMNRG